MSARLSTALRPLIKLTRPPFLLLEGVGCALFLITFQSGLGDPIAMGIAILAVLLIGAGGAAINDYFDYESDRITYPKRLIPSGEISPARALQFAIAMFVVGLGVSLTINPLVFSIVALNVVLFILYPRVFKRLSGFASNLLMGYLAASVALFAGAVVFQAINIDSLSFVGMVAAAIIAFNVLKDVLTLKGDVTIGYKTLAARHGIHTAVIVGSAFILLAIITAPLPYIMGVVNIAYLFPMPIAGCIAFSAALSLLRVPDTQNVQKQLKMFQICWISIPIALLANMLL